MEEAQSDAESLMDPFRRVKAQVGARAIRLNPELSRDYGDTGVNQIARLVEDARKYIARNNEKLLELSDRILASLVYFDFAHAGSMVGGEIVARYPLPDALLLRFAKPPYTSVFEVQVMVPEIGGVLVEHTQYACAI